MAIYDCCMYFDEDLLLDLRMNILRDTADKFVIVEATRDHSGKEKTLKFDINKFKKFKDRIIYHIVEDIPEKVINLKISNNQIQVNSINIEKPNPLLIKDPILRKDDIYALEFYNNNDELIYKLGIGNPFLVRAQHVGMEDEQHFNFEVPLKNFEVVIPNYIDPSYVSLIKRNNENIYSEINRFILN